MARNRPARQGKTRITKKELIHQVMTLFNADSSQSLNYRQVAKRIGDIKDEPTRILLVEVLKQLANEGQLAEETPGRFRAKKDFGPTITGKVDLTSNGFGYIVSPESETDVFVSQKNLRQALHGDTVKVQLFAGRRGAKLEGQVVEVIKRDRDTFVGTIGLSANFAFMIPDSRTMPYDFFIPPQNLNGAKDGQKVVARMVEWSHRAKNPVGEVIQVLGYPGENETEMHSILAEFNLPYSFTPEVEAAADAIPWDVTPDEIAKRRDFRGVPTFTIDPADAKDFDDALSFRKLDNGRWEVGVHIADVTHYIDTQSILEKEAQSRATSVYLVDRVVPMLPERLSNNLCSLRPKEEKLCYSAVFEIDDEAQVFQQWFGRTVICSDRRFSYEEAQEVIEKGTGEMQLEILNLHRLAQIQRKVRLEKGAISFDRPEAKFDLDEKGKPLSVYYKENKESNQLIEEFMLLANRQVAEFCSFIFSAKSQERLGKGKICVYRIHDNPNMEKLQMFSNFVARFGYSLKISSEKKVAPALNRLMQQVKGKPEENLVETLALRSMARAEYSVDNIGHYGLGFKYYTHFTSPIRRYPDMMVHRLLEYYLTGKGEAPDYLKLRELCEQSSVMERRASDAERASVKYKQVEFMSDKIGQVLDGVISGVTEWGIYVELKENKCEGMIHIRELTDDFYMFEEENYCIVGKHSKRRFQLGDPIRITVWRANLMKKQLDFKLAE